MALTTYRLTVDLVGIAGRDVSGIAVAVELDRNALVFPVGGAPVETLYPNHLASKTDASGIAEFDLLPSSVAGLYKVTVGGFTRTISMPEADARLSNLGDAVPPEEAGELADPVARAQAADAEAKADANTTFLSTFAQRVREIVEAVVPAWARAAQAPSGAEAATEATGGTVILARAEDVADSETDLSRVPTVRRAISLIRRLIGENVRSIPEAEESHVGFPLVAVASRPGADGGWRQLSEDGLDADVRAKLNAHTEAGGEGEQRVLVDVPASEATRDKIIEEDSQLYTTVDRVVHEATPKRASFESVRFDLGYFGDESALDPRFYAVGRFYYNFTKYTPRVVAYISGNSGPKHWVDANAADLVANITGDAGHFGGDTEATPHINAVGNVYYNEVLRLYRRARTFTPGQGPVTQPQRLRQANEDDIAALHKEAAVLDRVEFVVTPSPAALDVSSFPDAVEINVTVETNRWAANKLRVILLGQNTLFDFDPTLKKRTIRFPLTAQMKANARIAASGRNPSNKTTLHVGIQQDNVELASTNFEMSLRESGLGDLEELTSDLRLTTPPEWETAEGTGVGLAISRTLVSDLSTLVFSPMATVPAEASAGDEVYYYIAIPTAGLNLSDWRLDFAGVANAAVDGWGASVGTVGDNSVFSSAFNVGDGSGGLSSATAPGATVTLQHHGGTPHTAFSGELEGRALAQVRAEGGGGTGDGSGSYTLPQATEAGLGGVRGATQAQSQAASGTTILGWSLNRLKEVIRRNLPAASTTVRGGVLGVTQAIVDAGTSTGLFAWNIANLLRLIRTQIADWARRGDVSVVPAAKLGAGAAGTDTFLRGDGRWAAPAGLAPALSINQQAALASGVVEPNAIAYPFDGTSDQQIAALRREWRIYFPLIGELPDDIWVTANIQGTFLELLTTSGPIPANPVYSRNRKKLPITPNVPGTSQRLVGRIPSGGQGALDPANARTVNDAIRNRATSPSTGDGGNTSFDVSVQFFDAETGGNEIAEVHYSVSLIDAGDAATETAAGLVRGATAAESMAAAGSTILGWSNDRIRALIAAATNTSRPLTLAQQIGLTHVNPDPSVLSFTSADDLAAKLRGTFSLNINDRAEITSAVWVQVQLRTRSRVIFQSGRDALAAGRNDIVLDAAAVTGELSKLAAADIIGGQLLEVTLAWYAASAGGAAVTTQRYNIPTIRVPAARFETAVGRSPAVLPVGTRKISITFEISGIRDEKFYRVTALPAVAADHYLVEANPKSAGNANNLIQSLGYVPGTRTLTYGAARYGDRRGSPPVVAITAIGGA